MGVQIAILNGDDRETEIRWDAYVAGQRGASGYHQLCWKRILEKVYGYKSHYLFAEDGGTVVGILPLVQVPTPFLGRFVVSLPFATYGGIVADSPAVGRELLEAASGLAGSIGASHIEFRHFVHKSLDLPTSTHKVTMWLNLPSSTDSLWTAFPGVVRTSIRKAVKEGVEVCVGGAEETGNFYNIYSKNMRDLGSPAYPREFISTILQEWPGFARIATAYLHGEAVASGILLGFRESVEMPWSSSLREKNRARPNALLYWHCIQHAIASGFRCFDFGRSTRDSGPFVFKEKWGAKPVPLFWQYWLASPRSAIPNLSPGDPKFAHAIQVWQRLPVWMTRFVGPKLARFFP